MIQYTPHIMLSLNFIFGILLLFIVYYFKLDKARIERFSKFESYSVMFQYHLEKAYDIIYKDRILIYSLEATALDENEFKVVAKDFCILVLSLMGPALQLEFTKIYGNDETLYFNITEYFNTRFDDDEIRKTSQDNYMNSDVDEQGS